MDGNEPTQTEPMATETQREEVPTQNAVDPRDAQIQELNKQIQEKDKSYKGLQTKLNQANEELKKRGQSDSRIEALEENQRLLVAMLSEKGYVEPDEKKTDYLKKFDEIVAERKTRAKQDDFVNKVKEYQSRTDALGLDPNSDEYLEIRDLALEGKFERAERKLAKLETKEVKPEVKEGKLDLEKEKARIREEVRKEILKERGELNVETGQPSGSNKGLSVEAIRKMTPEEIVKNAKEIAKLPLTI